MQNIRPGRLAAAVALVALFVAFGLSAPLVFDPDSSAFKLPGGAVFAAPHDGHEIKAPVTLAPILRLRLNSGTIALDSPEGEATDLGALRATVPRN